jgi:protein-S-isoprenylcysteine O-methyltransferase Ste14
MYLAILALVVGQGMVFGNVSLLAYAAVLWILFHAWVVWYEEPKLVRQFGSSYQTYQKNVRRWWPRVRPWHAG